MRAPLVRTLQSSPNSEAGVAPSPPAGRINMDALNSAALEL